AAAKLMRIMLGEAGKTDELDERSGAAAEVVLGRAALELEPIADVALDRVPGEERVLLEHHGAIGTGRSDQLAVDADFAAVGFGQTVDSIQEGRLAAAAGADDGNELAFEDGEVDAVQHLKLSLHPLVVITQPDVASFQFGTVRCVHRSIQLREEAFFLELIEM